MDKGELYEFLAGNDLGVLGTLSEAGSPESALVGIAVTPELEVIFDTVNTSRKYRNLQRNQRASFVIGWTNEITVQYEGEARELVAGEADRYKEVYFAKWPDGRDRQKWVGIAYFVVKPNWIRYNDFNEGSRKIVEMAF